MVLLDHMEILFFSILRNCHILIAASPFHIPTNSVQGSQFFHIQYDTFWIFFLNLNGYEVK